MIVLFYTLLSILNLSAVHADEKPYELGLATNSVLMAPSPWSFQGSFDISKKIKDSETYELGLLADIGYYSTSSSFRLLFAPTVHPLPGAWNNAFFFRPLLGVARSSSGALTYFGISIGVTVGKRFPITDQLCFKPSIEFSRDAMDIANINFNILGLSLFLE